MANIGTTLRPMQHRRTEGRDHDTVRRSTAVMALIGIAVIHLMDLPGKYGEVPYLGVMFVGLIAVCLVLAVVLIRHDDAMAWLAGGALAAATIVGYTLSRTVGLPGEHGEEIGNWGEGIGLASLLIEGLLVWLAVSRLRERSEAA